MNYQAAVLNAPGQLSLETQRLDTPLAPTEVLLEILTAGVCGTDLSIYRGDYPVPLPLVLGHEFSARVIDTGPSAPAPIRALLGRNVVCEINNSCAAYLLPELDRCAACRRGLATHCLRRTVSGIIRHPGAFAQYLPAPSGNIHPLPDSISPDAAILIEPLAAAIRTFELCPLLGGETVVVLGCGRLGRLVALVASAAGASVIAVGRSSAHLDLIAPHATVCVQLPPSRPVSSDSDAHHSHPPPTSPTLPSAETSAKLLQLFNHDQLRDYILTETQGLGADIVVEAIANSDSLNLALSLVRPLGAICLKSTSGVPTTAFDITKAAVDEIRLIGSRCGPFDKAIEFMHRNKAPDASWITARFPLEQVAQAIEAAATEPKVAINVSRQ